MQKTFLRRNRDYHASVNQQDRLAELQIQSRSVSRWPLNAATEKSGPLRKSNTAF
jgi:hypothetical protein